MNERRSVKVCLMDLRYEHKRSWYFAHYFILYVSYKHFVSKLITDANSHLTEEKSKVRVYLKLNVREKFIEVNKSIRAGT